MVSWKFVLVDVHVAVVVVILVITRNAIKFTLWLRLYHVFGLILKICMLNILCLYRSISLSLSLFLLYFNQRILETFQQPIHCVATREFWARFRSLLSPITGRWRRYIPSVKTFWPLVLVDFAWFNLVESVQIQSDQMSSVIELSRETRPSINVCLAWRWKSKTEILLLRILLERY